MKYILTILIFTHGIIHLFGFAKAFNLAQIEQLSINIPKYQGIVWFIAFLMFTYTGEAFLSENPLWHWSALFAIVISTMLIIITWKDAKFGTIANIIILLVSLSSFSTCAFNKMINSEVTTIIEPEITSKSIAIQKEQLNNLPYPVAKWLKVSGIIDKEKINTVWLSQKARIKMNERQKDWNEAVVEQYFSIENPEFIWKVKMNILPFINIIGRDKFVDGKGEMQIKMFSAINIVYEKGDKINEASLQRFLAEIVWFPSAALNPYISWSEIDSLSAKATINFKGISGSGTFYFNEKGDFIKFCTYRFKDNKTNSKRYKWMVTVKDYSVMNEIKIPTKMEVSWMLDNEEWTWLDLEIVDIQYNINKMKTLNSIF